MATAYVGVLRDTLLPNLILHTSLALPAYVYARTTNTVETKDYLWPSGQLFNALYTAIGSRLVLGVPLFNALSTITRPGWLVLSGATLWASRLTYRVISRGIRRGKDDERYNYVKEEKGGWTKALWSLFVPEAIVQSLVTLPFTAPFRTTYPVLACPPEWKATIETLAIGLFGVGFALEVAADWQLEKFKQSGETGINREGVWSIVRHPNYLGDILIHASFPLVLYPNSLLHPILLLGPITNYIFLRYVSGDKENEESQAHRYATTDPAKMSDFNQYRQDKNAVWPAISEFTNKWTWGVLGAGAGAVVLERVIRGAF